MAAIVSEPRGHRRTSFWITVVSAGVLVALAAIGFFAFRIAVSSANDAPLDLARVQRVLAANGDDMEPQARQALTAAQQPGSSCRGQNGGPRPTVPTVPIAGGVQVWCSKEMDHASMGRWVLEVDGVDPQSRCTPGTALAVFAVPEAQWGTPYMVYSERCAPTSWFDGDPYYGREFVPVGGPWYAVRLRGAALANSW